MSKYQPMLEPSDLVAHAEARHRKTRRYGQLCLAVVAVNLFALILLFTR